MPWEPGNWMLVFARAGAFLAVFPAFAAPNFPVRVRVALGAMIAALIAPSLPPVTLGQMHFLGLVGLCAVEVGAGLLLGFVSRMAFFALELASGLIAMEMGLNLSTVFNPLTPGRSESLGVLANYFAVMLLFTLNLHHWMLLAFQHSYALVPVGGMPLSQRLLTDVVGQTGQVFQLGLLLAGPIIAVTFVITLVFALLGRAVPQMNVFAESFAFRTLGGLLVFGLALNMMAQHIADALRRFPEELLRLAS
jgi:flagellar biosynthetic protein FliR